jgi:hypothetical protein
MCDSNQAKRTTRHAITEESGLAAYLSAYGVKPAHLRRQRAHLDRASRSRAKPLLWWWGLTPVHRLSRQGSQARNDWTAGPQSGVEMRARARRHRQEMAFPPPRLLSKLW